MAGFGRQVGDGLRGFAHRIEAMKPGQPQLQRQVAQLVQAGRRIARHETHFYETDQIGWTLPGGMSHSCASSVSLAGRPNWARACSTRLPSSTDWIPRRFFSIHILSKAELSTAAGGGIKGKRQYYHFDNYIVNA